MKEAQQHGASHPETGASLLIDVVVTYFRAKATWQNGR